MFVPSSAPLLIGPTNSGASMDKLHTSTEPLWLNLLWLTRCVFPLHLAYYTHNIIFIITHCPASTCLCGISARRPAWFTESCNWITQSSWSQSFKVHTVTMLETLKKKLFQFHLSSWKIPTKDLKVRFQLRENKSAVYSNVCDVASRTGWKKQQRTQIQGANFQESEWCHSSSKLFQDKRTQTLYEHSLSNRFQKTRQTQKSQSTTWKRHFMIS